MIRIGGAIIIVLVAEETLRGSSRVLTIDMAQVARHGLVGACQWEIGVVVIKRGRAPCSRRVAHSAVVRELVCQMIGVGRRVIVRLMAREAVRRRSCILTVDMTLGAGNGLMGAR